MTLPCGREDVDLFRADLEAQIVEELARVFGLGLPVADVGEPRHLGVVRPAIRLAATGVDAFLVLPVRGDTELGALVHLVRADLDLDGTALRPDHRRVQRLVQVELRRRDVVLEATRDRVPAGVDRAEHGVAVADVVDEHPDADEVVDLGELATANHHLLVDRVVLLRSADDLALDLARLEVVVDRVDDLLHELFALRGAVAHETLDLDVELRVEHGEREVFELPLDRLDAEPVRERRVDLEGLLRLALRGLLGHEAPGARVVQPVGELDDENPDVFAHRDDHLAHGLGLSTVAVLELVELRDAVDEHRDLVAEVGAHHVERVVGVFDGVVQQCGSDRLRADAEVGEDLRDRDRMRDVRLAALALLARVRLLSGRVGTLDQRHVRLRVVRAHRLQQTVDGARGLRAGEDARQQCAQRCRARRLRLRHGVSLGFDTGVR